MRAQYLLSWHSFLPVARNRPHHPSAAHAGQRGFASSQPDVAVASEWVGTLDGNVNAQISASVSGYLVQQAYKEGSVVAKGQMLFEI